MNEINNHKSYRNITILLTLTFVIIFIKIFTQGIVISLGGDELLKWGLANDFNFFQTHLSFTHHEMRWSHWLQTKIFTIISDDFWSYYLSSIIPLTLGILIISLSVLRVAGILPAILFIIISSFDQNLLNLSFKLLPSNGTLLPLAILIFLLLKENFRLDNFKNIFIVLILCIWMYGIKETNIFFVPGIMYLIFLHGGVRYLVQFIFLFFSFYVIETLMFVYHADGPMSTLGRFHQLFNIGNEYIFDRMKNYDSNILNLNAQVNKWTNSKNSYIYISLMFILINNFIISKSFNNKLANLNFSYPIISFIIFSTFMIGQAFNERYWFILIPIFYANLIVLLYFFFKKVNIVLKCFIVLFFFLILNNTIIKNIYNSIYNPNSLVSIIEDYNYAQKKILDADCVKINSNKNSSYAVAYYFFVSLMRVHEYAPYQIIKIDNNNEDFKYSWKLQKFEKCNKNYELNIQMKEKGMYKLILN